MGPVIVSFRNHAPHITPKIGTRKVTLTAGGADVGDQAEEHDIGRAGTDHGQQHGGAPGHGRDRRLQVSTAAGSSTSEAATMLPVALVSASTPVRKRLVQLAAMP